MSKRKVHYACVSKHTLCGLKCITHDYRLIKGVKTTVLISKVTCQTCKDLMDEKGVRP